MSEAEAASTLFPGKKFERAEIELTDQDVEKIEKASGAKVRSKKLKLFKSPSKELVFIDQVLGKHEFITYAVGIDSSGKVAGIEIIEYRESYGGQIRKPEWRAQFTGKETSSQLKLGGDIKNISGATLSCAHVTSGVKRLLQTYDVVHSRL